MTDLHDLNHTRKSIENGGEVIVLDTGATIPAEAEAMLQALHSRSVGGLDTHLKKLKEKGAEKFMSTYYVGYGHKSIGDCGSTTLFIEGVSMLAAKAIQDWPLYNGQESSTRYIDFSEQTFLNPTDLDAGEEVLENWREFYLEGLEVLTPHLKDQFPKKDDEKQATYDKAINARSFDIMRGFLPAGATTNLAWHSNLRQIADKLLMLRQHPLAEVRNIAAAIEAAVLGAYPSSFSDKRYEATEKYNEMLMQKYNYFDPESKLPQFELTRNNVDINQLKEYEKALENRPEKTELPKTIAECGQLQFSFLLDFGSFRDIQRQRAVTQRMPLLSTKHGFNQWYLSELPDDFQDKTEAFLDSQEKALGELETSKETKQYYTAMGYNTPNRVTGNLHAIVYLVELRATRFVHPTLRKRAAQMADALLDNFADAGLTLHLDEQMDRFDVARGEHDIVEK